MTCPYCKNGMLRGYIPSDRIPVQWIPEEEKPPIFWRLARRAVQLSDWSYWKTSKVTAFYCPCCEVTIIPAD